ncbi:MAG TPA: 3'-5' exonuclease [Chitinophagaceae bacterium]|nr:3'-5' exonuclease [Chitinophagaceae bacterium]
MNLLNNILFLDIETVSQHESYHNVPDPWQKLWQTKAENLLRYHADSNAEDLYNRAAIYAEFGKIICISCGVIQGYGKEKKLVIKSFCNEDEKELLTEFSDMLCKWAPENNKFLCAHNGKEFDFPYLCRRMVINFMKLPACLQIAGRKPWEIPHIDTMEMWKFGDYKNFTSLNLLAHSLGISTPKDDIDGSMVGDVYWKEKNLQRIVSYCQKDVVTVAQVYLRLHGEELLKEENIELKP